MNIRIILDEKKSSKKVLHTYTCSIIPKIGEKVYIGDCLYRVNEIVHVLKDNSVEVWVSTTYI